MRVKRDQKLMISRNSKIHRLEDLKGAIIGVSQYSSEADTFARNTLATGRLKPNKNVTIIQLGGHPQVAAAIGAGKLEVGALAGLAALTAERSTDEIPNARAYDFSFAMDADQQLNRAGWRP
jgi:ABC-type nitrate/sulfonate/bicarbonate transport system substrate-binding protein